MVWAHWLTRGAALRSDVYCQFFPLPDERPAMPRLDDGPREASIIWITTPSKVTIRTPWKLVRYFRQVGNCKVRRTVANGTLAGTRSAKYWFGAAYHGEKASHLFSHNAEIDSMASLQKRSEEGRRAALPGRFRGDKEEEETAAKNSGNKWIDLEDHVLLAGRKRGWKHNDVAAIVGRSATACRIRQFHLREANLEKRAKLFAQTQKCRVCLLGKKCPAAVQSRQQSLGKWEKCLENEWNVSDPRDFQTQLEAATPNGVQDLLVSAMDELDSFKALMAAQHGYVWPQWTAPDAEAASQARRGRQRAAVAGPSQPAPRRQGASSSDASMEARRGGQRAAVVGPSQSASRGQGASSSETAMEARRGKKRAADAELSSSASTRRRTSSSEATMAAARSRQRTAATEPSSSASPAPRASSVLEVSPKTRNTSVEDMVAQHGLRMPSHQARCSVEELRKVYCLREVREMEELANILLSMAAWRPADA
ncbi:hypothetical protein Q7P37_004515 [Cladosporium fusiforme]